MTEAELKEFIVREIARTVDAYLAPLREEQRRMVEEQHRIDRKLDTILLHVAALNREIGIEEGEAAEPSHRN